MDLDEFLNENGIPVDEAGKALRGGGGGGGGGGPGNTNATNKGGNNGGGGGARDLTSPTISVSPEAPSPSSPEVMPIGLGVVPQGPPVSHPTPSTPAPPTHSIPPPCLSPDDSNLMTDDCCSSDSGSPHSPALQVHEGDSVRASLGREKEVEVLLKGAAAKEAAQSRLAVDFEVSPNDLALATVPGQDFDPRTRMFSEDELKPQPMIKKSRKQVSQMPGDQDVPDEFVPMELKDDKYWARRRKNNMAAKRSRDARRLKENQIAMRANFLERENDTLTAELQKAQTVVDALKKRLAVYEVV
ncbi:Hepatic leukemia factor [Chionoecetes opilio]|uniref:Hepatic leukemia factor n=1 Tax=Chionoecetes opilio TaxID=41210 RepID=A0A8J4YTP0_CHIOP|nr:Hepatic leukemia factor [Chionoecetes opilio]